MKKKMQKCLVEEEESTSVVFEVGLAGRVVDGDVRLGSWDETFEKSPTSTKSTMPPNSELL
jgi:hypothetical protein